MSARCRRTCLATSGCSTCRRPTRRWRPLACACVTTWTPSSGRRTLRRRTPPPRRCGVTPRRSTLSATCRRPRRSAASARPPRDSATRPSATTRAASTCTARWRHRTRCCGRGGAAGSDRWRSPDSSCSVCRPMRQSSASERWTRECSSWQDGRSTWSRWTSDRKAEVHRVQ